MIRRARSNRAAWLLAVLAWGLLWGSGCASNSKTAKNEVAGPLIEGIGVTKLYAADPAKLADWYGSRFLLTFKPDGSGFVTKDNSVLGPVWIAINQAPALEKLPRLDITFFVRNLDQVLGQLSLKGTSPLRLDRDNDGRPKAYVLDPEGNRIELVQY